MSDERLMVSVRAYRKFVQRLIFGRARTHFYVHIPTHIQTHATYIHIYIHLHIRMFLTDTLQYDTSDRFTRGYETLNRYRCNVPVPGGNLLCLGQGSSDWQEEVVVILK